MTIDDLKEKLGGELDAEMETAEVKAAVGLADMRGVDVWE